MAGKCENDYGKYISQQPEHAFATDGSMKGVFIHLFTYVNSLVGGHEAAPRPTRSPHFVHLATTGLTPLQEPWHSDNSS